MVISGILDSVSNAASAATSQISGKAFEAYFQQRQPLVKQLGQELKSGDLAGAQAAYDKLSALASQNGLQNPFLRQDRAADFSALGAALKSGDVAATQQAFATLKQDLGRRTSLPQPVPPDVLPDVIVMINGNGGAPAPAPTPAPVNQVPPTPAPNPAPAPAPAPAPPEVVVTINDQKGSVSPSEQIVLNLNGGNGAKVGEQISIGISQNSSGEQISLSFGNSGSSSSASPSVLLNLGSTPSEIDIALSQTSSGGEQIPISFGLRPSRLR